MCKPAKRGLVTGFIAAAFVLTTITTPAADFDGAAKSQTLIRIGVLSDRTGSAKANSTPEILPEDLERAIAMLREIGGQLGVTTVTAHAEGELLRLAIAPAAPKPVPPRPSASPFERQRQMARYRSALAAWEANEGPRLQRADAAIQAFKKQLPALLVGPRTDQRSNVSAALIRLDRFFREPLAMPNYVAINLAVIGSDLQHNTGGERHHMVSAPITAWLSRTEREPSGFHIDAAFENTTAAFDWIIGPALTAAIPVKTHLGDN